MNARRQRTLQAVEELFGKGEIETALKISDNLFISKKRYEEGHKGNNLPVYEKELAMAEMMAAAGHVIFMLPEEGEGKHPDAIMDGFRSELKEVTGSRNKIGRNFLKSQKQANTSILRMAGADVTLEECVSKIYGSIKSAVKNFDEGKKYGCWIFLDKKGPYFINVDYLIRKAKKS